MNNTDYKIVHKKPTNYENSTLSLNSDLNSNLSNNLTTNPNPNPNHNLNPNINLESEVNYILTNIYKLNDEESIKKAIIDYFNMKKYSEQTQHLILLELKNKTDYPENNENEVNEANLNNIVQIDSFDKNNLFLIVAGILILIVIIAFYFKLKDE